MPSILSGFFAGVSAAIVLKLASSIDDVLWLSAFLTPSLSYRERLSNSLTYLFICFFQTCLAYVISNLGEATVEKFLVGTNMSTDRILTLLAGSILSVYSVYLGIEYYRENWSVDKRSEYEIVSRSESAECSHSDYSNSDAFDFKSDEKDDHDILQENFKTGVTPLELEVEACMGGVKAKAAPSENTLGAVDANLNEHHEKHSRSLTVIAFLGSLDDLTLFVPMLAGKSFNILELIIGAMISTIFIVIICLCLTKCKLVADVLDRVPLVAIVGAFAIILIIKGARLS